MPDQYPRRFGKYVLLEPLAQGGMGALYLACQGEFGMEKLCVVKTVLRELADKEYQARFRDEAKVVVRLSHGNLVPVFDAGTVAGEIYIAMDYVDGKDLRAVWNRCASKGIAFPIDVAAYVVKELARGLSHAHIAGDLRLVHRDVSPPNVLLAYSGEVKLTDFGLASSTLKLEQTAPGVIYGKVSYMAPEQARGEALDGRTDEYAAGVILWELLTGRQLFPNTDGEALGKVRNPVITRPSLRASRVPAALDLIVMKALAPGQADRYPDCEAFRAALAGFLAREAPTLDNARVAAFLRELFEGEIGSEQTRRQRLVEGARHLAPESSNPIATLGRSTSEAVGSAGLAAGGSAGSLASDGAVRAVSKRIAPDPEAGVSPRQNGLAILPDGDASDRERERAEERERSAGILGKRIGGRYQVKALIGEGGMGRVYEAEHVEIGKRVAIKVLHPIYSRSPDLVARFRREARAASRIGHPNIIDVTDSGTTDAGDVYFVMEFLVGSDLAGVINREKALDVDRAIRIAVQLCRALDAAHTAGVIHRDLKPENIFLIARAAETDVVKVLDFGIARNLDLEGDRRLTRPDMAMGTPEYMAPEQAAGKPADARSDVYAAGAIVYEMLSGKPPHTGEHAIDVLTKKATLIPRPVTEFRNDVGSNLSGVIARALSFHPEQRQRTMGELCEDLERCRPDRRRSFVGGARTDEVPRSARPELKQPSARPPEFVHAAPAAAVAAKLRSASRRRAAAVVVIAFAAVVVSELGISLWRSSGTGAKNSPSGAALTTRRLDPLAVTPSAPALSASPSGMPAATKSAPPANPASALRSPVPVIATHSTATSVASGNRATVPPSAATNPRRLVDEANRLLRDHQLAAAGRIYQRLFDANEERGNAAVGLARVAFESGRYDEAQKSADRAVHLGGGVPARLILGDASLKLGRYADAVREYRAILKLKPGHVDARRHLEAALAKQGG